MIKDNIDWHQVRKFKSADFSESPDTYAEPRLIYSLDAVREFHGHRVYPSPVPGALARFDGSMASQHYVGNKQKPTRLATAVDIFPEGIPMAFFTCALGINAFKGVGIYLDTTGIDGTAWVMFHLDIRPKGFDDPQPLIWIATKQIDTQTRKVTTKYFYPQSDTSKWALLNNPIMYEDKVRI